MYQPNAVTVKSEAIDNYLGQPAYRIRTPMCDYVYHQFGGGFASMIDPDGRDWISYRPGDGARGEYRGIPNLVHPSAGFHPGGTMCDSELIAKPGDIRIATRSTDGEWSADWVFHPDHALMTLHTAARPHWILYEGTPGGEYDESQAYCVDSAGVTRRCDDRWETRLPEPRWIWFAAPRSPYALFLLDLTSREAGLTDSYWSMEQSMTVFGFGRRLSGGPGWKQLTETPARLAIGLSAVDGIERTLRQIVAHYCPSSV